MSSTSPGGSPAGLSFGRPADDRIRRIGEREAAPLHDRVVEAEALSVPVEQLQPVAASATERKYRAAGRVLAQHILRQG